MRQVAEFVQAGNDISIFNIGQPADVHDEARTARHRSEFIARGLHVSAQVARGPVAIAIRAAWDPLKGFNFIQRTPEFHYVKASEPTPVLRFVLSRLAFSYHKALARGISPACRPHNYGNRGNLLFSKNGPQ